MGNAANELSIFDLYFQVGISIKTNATATTGVSITMTTITIVLKNRYYVITI